MSDAVTSLGRRYLVSAPDQPRVRRAGDVTSVLVGVLLLLWAILNLTRTGPLNAALAGLVDVLPEWSLEPLSIAYSFGFLYAISVLVMLILGGRRRRDALRDVLLAVVLAAIVGVVVVRFAQGVWPNVLPELGLEQPKRQTPVFRIAVTTATLVAASPHLVRPLRRVGWALIALSVLAGAGLGFGLPSDAIGAIGVGLLAAGTVFLVLGVPAGVADLSTISTAMASLGLPVTDLRVPASRSWGVRRVLATGADGREVTIKVYGRDATDQQLLAKAWRSLLYREERRTFTYSRLQSVQQEALLGLWAARARVPVREVLAAGAPDGELALLALSAGGERLDRVPAEDVSEALLTDLWRHVATLHAAGMAHGSLDTRVVRVDGADLLLEDLGAGSLSATTAARGADVAGLLFSLAVLVGPERAVDSALRGYGVRGVRAALPYLQLPAIAGPTRALASRPKEVLAALSAALTERLGEDLPEPVELRRVTPRTLVLVTLGILAAWILVPMIAGIDLAKIATELATAQWGWVLVAAIVGQAVFFTEAVSVMFATTASVPYRPLVVLQVSAKLVGVVTPGVTGTVATNATFLSRFGVSPAASITQGTMDTLGGIIVEITVLLMAFLFTDLDLGIDLATSDIDVMRLLLVLVIVIAGSVAFLAALPRVREALQRFLSTVWEAARAVVAEPTRAIGLLGGNLATRVIRALVLWFALVALDQRLGLGVLLVVVIATGLLQAFIPVPGGIGVSEAVMAGLLVGFGVPEAPAFAATVIYRAIIFYLPIVQGAVAMGWLTRKGYV